MGEFFVYSTFLGTLAFFFPVFLWLDVYADLRKNRAWFSLSAYRRMKFFGGYSQLDREGIAIHISKKKAIFLPFDQMGDTRKKFEITKGFQLWRFHQVVETGGSEHVYGIFLAALIQSVSGGTFGYLKTKHPFLSLKNSTLLGEKPCLKLSFQTAVIFNGFILTLAITKKILEALINWIRKRKLTAFSKRRQNS